MEPTSIKMVRHKTQLAYSQYDQQQKENVPAGLIPLQTYSKEFDSILRLPGSDIISPHFYTRVLPKNFKMVGIVKATGSLFTKTVYDFILKFNGQRVMSTRKSLLGKTLITSLPQYCSEEIVVAKLHTAIGKDTVTLYTKHQNIASEKPKRCQLAYIKFTKDAEMLIIPKVDDNVQVRKQIGEGTLQKEYMQAKTQVTAMKVHRSVYPIGKTKREYIALRDMLSSPYSDKMMLRKIAQNHWQCAFSYPLSPVQTFGFILSLIDRQRA